MRHTPGGWDELSLTDLFYAFRKAKADCFYETSIRVSERFSNYEESLGTNLSELLSRLQRGEAATILMSAMEQPILFPKRLSVNEAAPATTRGHAFFSDASRAFDRSHSGKALVPEFRMIGDFSVETHVLSALWVNLVGHKFDERLSPRALASRVRRYRPSKEREMIGPYHLEAIGSFEPYFEPYRRWRDDGLAAMRTSIEANTPIVALTLDVGNFYHSIDPSFISDSRFQAFMGVRLTPFEAEFTALFSAALHAWSGRCVERLRRLGCEVGSEEIGGIPIGLSVVRILSNALLHFLDEEIVQKLTPIYYARYVDDLFLVLHDHDRFRSQEDLWSSIESRIPSLKRDGKTGDVSLQLPPWAGLTEIRLQAAKQKAFFLSGQAGLDLLENIAAQIRAVSSERRLMPLPEQLDQTQSAKALAATETADNADSLRRADGLTLRRLGWSVLLRSVEALARDLRPKDWVKERNRFYDFAHDHVIRPDKILEQLDHLPRLFSVAITLSDWKQGALIYRGTISAIYSLENATKAGGMRINGKFSPDASSSVWDETRHQVRRFFREALLRAIPMSDAPLRSKALSYLLTELDFAGDSLERLGFLARETDWARKSYKEHLRQDAKRPAPERADEEVLRGRYAYEEILRRFLDRSDPGSKSVLCRRVAVAAAEDGDLHSSLLPYLFPTRPYTAQEIALYLPDECVFAGAERAAYNWAEYTRAVRGVWVRSSAAEDVAHAGGHHERMASASGDTGSVSAPGQIVIEGVDRKRPIKLGITSFGTSDKTWAQAAAGSPDLSPARYKAIALIVNQAVKEQHRPDYLLLPELSLPDAWIPTVSGRLRDAGISLIAGLDYTRHPDDEIDSSAVVVLDDHRLGFPSSLQIRQRKSLPAPAEEESLFTSHGQSWKKSDADRKPVYSHNGFHFGILVCSELQNISYRSSFQGHVDCMIVLSWNKDIETFSALVDSASFDVHAYIALVNNLRYGDSRVRRPSKQSHLRDVCRVRGGLNNQLVVVEIDPANLRAQQSRTKRWPRANDHYKPAPEGFRISDARWSIPS